VKNRWTAKPAFWCAVSIVAVAVMGCSSGSHPPAAVSSPSVAPLSSSKTTQPVATTSTTAPAAGNNACAQAPFSPQQFTGDWTEPGDTTITTLNADGTLRSSGGNHNESGTWSYVPWELTPGKSQMPAGEENQCVLWLHWALPEPPTDLVYVPLKVSSTSLQISYVDRGNTHNWVRPKPAN
jgi:hypothetical protein